MKNLANWIDRAIESATPETLPVVLNRIQWEINKALEDAGDTRTEYMADSPPPQCPTCPPTP